MNTRNRNVALIAVLAALTLSPHNATAQMAKKGAKHAAAHETHAQLKAEAKITADAATVIALAQVPGGSVKSSELAREDGKLIYTFDIATKGKSGIDEVHVDAISGAVISKVHETSKKEKTKAKADAKVKSDLKKSIQKAKLGEKQEEKKEYRKP